MRTEIKYGGIILLMLLIVFTISPQMLIFFILILFFISIYQLLVYLTHKKEIKIAEGKSLYKDSMDNQQKILSQIRRNQLKKILSVSNRLKLEYLREVLELERTDFYDNIEPWSAEFNFKIEDDHIICSNNEIPQFISRLDELFYQWNKRDKAAKFENIK